MKKFTIDIIGIIICCIWFCADVCFSHYDSLSFLLILGIIWFFGWALIDYDNIE